ncbi:MAG: hypothetical protein H8E62_06140 [Planctomycetes bacterium]|nr:hypothetical protein [Planctomycetota bacterium]
MFRLFFQGDPVRQATQGLSKGALVLGLFLIGFGMLVFVLRDLFAFIAAAIFFIAGFSAIGYAIRMFILQYKMKDSSAYRENVEIHIEDDDY